MKRLWSYIIVLMIPMLFIGNIGFDVFEHTCREDGVSTAYFINTIDHCDNHIEDLPPCCQESHKEDDCCHDEISFYQIKLDYFKRFGEIEILNFPVHTPGLILSRINLYDQQDLPERISYCDPPPLGNSKKRALIQVYII